MPMVQGSEPHWEGSHALGGSAFPSQASVLEQDGRDRLAVEKWRELFGWRMPRP